MRTLEIYYVGIDVSKAKLDVYCRKWNSVKTFDNTPEALKKLFEQLLSLKENLHVVCEATGGYEKPLMNGAFENKIPISRVNPRQIRDFARAKGQLAKTDHIDVKVIAEYGEIFKPRLTKMPSDLQQNLSSISRRRWNLVCALKEEKTISGKETNAFTLQNIKESMDFLKKSIKSCEDEIKKMIDSNEEMKGKKERLELVQGVGPITSGILLAELPELGKIANKEIASLVGLAPMNRDSGDWRGKRKIMGGRGHVRQALYMPALSASQHNPVLREFYRRLRAENKPHHVALTAVMRKLICILNRILADPNFIPK